MAGLALIAVAAFGAYWFSVWRHPYRSCTSCGGSKAHRDQQFTGAWGRCHSCDGSGKRVRWGVRVLTPGAYRAITAGRKGKNY